MAAEFQVGAEGERYAEWYAAKRNTDLLMG